MTVEAKLRRRFREVESELTLIGVTGLVRDVTGFAAHVERGVTAATCGDAFSGLVTSEAEIRFFATAGRLKQVVLEVGRVRTVTLGTVANRWAVNLTFDFGSVLVCVAGNAKGNLGGGDQLNAGDIFIDPDFVTACTPHGDRRMDDFALRLIFMALNTLRGVGIFLERHGVLAGKAKAGPHQDEESRSEPNYRFHGTLR